MDSESSLVQIALELESGGVDELLVGRVVGNGMLVKMGVCTQRAQVEVDDAIRFRQKPGRFRRRIFAQEGGQGEKHENDENDKDSRLGAPSHGGKTGARP